MHSPRRRLARFLFGMVCLTGLMPGETALAEAFSASVQEIPKSKDPITQKISPALQRALEQAAGAKTLRLACYSSPLVRFNDAGEVHLYVEVDSISESALKALADRGLRMETANAEMGLVQGWAPSRAIESLARLKSVRAIRPPDYAHTRMGSCMTGGDAILNADAVRAAGVRGAGTKIGVLSDGVTNRAVAQASGDLPQSILIDPAYPGSGDEGTAILEILYDIAPDARLVFSGPYTSVEFVNGLNYLVNIVGCDIVLDDVGFYAEPYFEDGPVARAVAAIVDKTVYVSACGNDGHRHWQGPYHDWNPGMTGWPNDLHLFGPGDTANLLIVPPGGRLAVFLQWSEPVGATASDYDLFLYDDQVTTALTWSNAVQDGDDNPYEALTWHNAGGAPVRVNVLVNRAAGPIQTLELFTWDVTWMEQVISADAIFGHPSVPGVVSAGAISEFDPDHDTIAGWSSIGPSTILFPAPEIRNTPALVGIDGVAVTGAGGFTVPYFGTSAAAAHVAAIAALVKSRDLDLTPGQVRDRLQQTAVDLGIPGYDLVYGYGRVNAFEAVPPLPETGARHWSFWE